MGEREGELVEAENTVQYTYRQMGEQASNRVRNILLNEKDVDGIVIVVCARIRNIPNCYIDVVNIAIAKQQ